MKRDPITLNNRLGHYSYFANLLDLCAVAIPNGVLPNGIPMGVTLLAPAWTDRALIALARRLEVGATGTPFALTSRARWLPRTWRTPRPVRYPAPACSGSRSGPCYSG